MAVHHHNIIYVTQGLSQDYSKTTHPTPSGNEYRKFHKPTQKWRLIPPKKHSIFNVSKLPLTPKAVCFDIINIMISSTIFNTFAL